MSGYQGIDVRPIRARMKRREVWHNVMKAMFLALLSLIGFYIGAQVMWVVFATAL